MRSLKVNEDEIRRMFNEGRYYERMQEEGFHAVIVSKNRRRRGDRRVRNTVSQTVEYWDKFGGRVAVVHQYRKNDGALGGSGRPDPKLVHHEGVLYVLDQRESWDLPEWDEH